MQTLLLTADALRADHLSQYGYHRDTMPVLDRLSDEGTTYSKAFANGAHTKLSIPSLFTSRYNGLDAIDSGDTLGSVLQEAGVTTAAYHSNPVIVEEFDRIPGFDDYYDFVGSMEAENRRADGGSTISMIGKADSLLERAVSGLSDRFEDSLGRVDWIRRLHSVVDRDRWHHTPTPYADASAVTERAVEWLTDHARNDFFLWVHYMEPHRPYGYSPSEPAFAEVAPTYDEMIDLMASAGQSPEHVTEQERNRLIDLYDSDVRFLSEQLQRLFLSLDELDIWNDAQIIFSADHGEEFGDHGLYFHRNYPYEELIHVPLFYKAPEAGVSVLDDRRELVDVAPTVLRHHGVTVPESFQGTPLDQDRGDRPVFATAHRREFSIAVRTDAWKYISASSGTEELYDLSEDPSETNSLMAERPSVGAGLREGIPGDVESMAEVLVQDYDEDVSAETRRRLSDLGYLE